MAFLSSGSNVSEYLTLITDRDKIKAAATESLEEYLVSNRFGWAPDRISVYDPIQNSISAGYKANIECLYFYYKTTDKLSKIATKEKLLKYDFLPTAGLDIPVMKAAIAELFKQYCGDKVQIIDVVITLQNGEKLTDYKAVNVVNRVEAFTWEGSEKGLYYDEHNRPNASSLRVLAFDRNVINKAIICKDSITNINLVLISDDLGKELLKHKFKGLGVFFESYGGWCRIIG